MTEYRCGHGVLYAVGEDGQAKMIGVTGSLQFDLGAEPMPPAPATLSGSVSISFKEFTRRTLCRIAKAFGLKRRDLYSPAELAFERLRRHMKAKLRGKNWRNVR